MILRMPKDKLTIRKKALIPNSIKAFFSRVYRRAKGLQP